MPNYNIKKIILYFKTKLSNNFYNKITYIKIFFFEFYNKYN